MDNQPDSCIIITNDVDYGHDQITVIITYNEGIYKVNIYKNNKKYNANMTLEGVIPYISTFIPGYVMLFNSSNMKIYILHKKETIIDQYLNVYIRDPYTINKYTNYMQLLDDFIKRELYLLKNLIDHN
jgi:hypothetical protein